MTSADHLRALLRPLAPWEWDHVAKCMVCRRQIRDAHDAVARAHGSVELAAVMINARETHRRCSRQIARLRRDLDRRRGPS